MVVTLVLTGVPYRVDLYQLASHLNNILITNDIGTCRMRTLSNHRKTNKRQIGLDFKSGFEAMPAQDLLNGYDYESADGTFYKIQAKISSCESAMAHSLDSIEGFEREIYEFSMSDLLKRPKVHSSIEKDIRRKWNTPMIKYETGSDSDSEDDRKRKHRHSPDPSRSTEKKCKRVIKENEKRTRYKSPSPSHSKKKKLKKSKKSSKLKESKSALKRKEEKKLEKMKKKKKKRKMSSDSSLEKSSDDSDIEHQKQRKRAKKKKKSEDNYNSYPAKDYKILQKRLKQIERFRSKLSESSPPKDTLRDQLILEDVKTDNNHIVKTKSEDIYVWSDDSCDNNVKLAKHVNSKSTNNKQSSRHGDYESGRLFTAANINIDHNSSENILKLKNSNAVEKKLESLKRQNSIGEATSTCPKESRKSNKIDEKINKKKSHEPFNLIAEGKQSLEELSNIITLTYDDFEKQTKSIVIKSEPNDDFKNDEIDSKAQFGVESKVIKSEPKDDIENELDSELSFSCKTIVIKSEPVDESENEKIDSEFKFSTKSTVIKSELYDELDNQGSDLKLKSDRNQDNTISVNNIDYDSESTLELEVEHLLAKDSFSSSNQEGSTKLIKPKEDDLKIWDVLDEVLQDMPADIF